MKLNRTGIALNRNTWNGDNENWAKLEKKYNDVVGEITDEVFNKIVDGSKIDWSQMVDTVADLPNDAGVGETRGVKEDNKIYRFDGSNWIPIAEINLNPIAEIDERLSNQLAGTDEQRRSESAISRKQIDHEDPRNNLIISWVDDDGQSSYYDKFKPVVEEKGVPMTCALITNRIEHSVTGTYLSKEQIRELSDLGVEFISHGHYHGFIDENGVEQPQLKHATPEQIEHEFKETTKYMKKWGLNYRGISLPHASNNYHIQRLGRKYFDYMIGTSSDKERGLPFYPGHYSNYYIRRVRADDGFDLVEQRIDEAAENGIGWVILGSHSYENSITTEFIEQVVDYAHQKGFKFVSTQEGMDIMGNVMQFGIPQVKSHGYVDAGNRISATGEIFGDDLGKVREVGFGEVTPSTPISYFEKDVVSFTRIRGSDADGFPRDAAGILTTYRYSSSDRYAYQTYAESGSTRFSLRDWDDDHNSWNDWQSINLSRFIGVNAIGPDERAVGEILKDRVTYTTVNSGDEGFPDAKAGTLVTYSFTRDNFPFQEFYVYQESKVYQRHWRGDGWGPWYLVQTTVGAKHEPRNRITASTSPNDLEQGISVSYITTSGGSGLPSGSSGNFVSVKEDGGNGRTYQQFRPHGSSGLYYRFTKSNNDWSAWYKFVMEKVD